MGFLYPDSFHVDVLAEEVEDDEVAGAVWHSEAPTVPEDQVPSLTDKTFQTTRDGSDLLVVKFFQPCKYNLIYTVQFVVCDL